MVTAGCSVAVPVVGPVLPAKVDTVALDPACVLSLDGSSDAFLAGAVRTDDVVAFVAADHIFNAHLRAPTPGTDSSMASIGTHSPRASLTGSVRAMSPSRSFLSLLYCALRCSGLVEASWITFRVVRASFKRFYSSMVKVDHRIFSARATAALKLTSK